MKIRRPHLLLALVSVSACGGGTTIVDNPVVEVVVMPENPSIELGLTVQFTAQARNASGQAVTGLPITWASGNEAVATIDGRAPNDSYQAARPAWPSRQPSSA